MNRMERTLTRLQRSGREIEYSQLRAYMKKNEYMIWELTELEEKGDNYYKIVYVKEDSEMFMVPQDCIKFEVEEIKKSDRNSLAEIIKLIDCDFSYSIFDFVFNL